MRTSTPMVMARTVEESLLGRERRGLVGREREGLRRERGREVEDEQDMFDNLSQRTREREIKSEKQMEMVEVCDDLNVQS